MSTKDASILVSAGAYLVMHQRHEVLFRDGSAIGLHQVQHNGVISHYLRCVTHGDLHAVVFDVRDLVTALKEELPVTPARDMRGLVSMSMRLAFEGADQFLAAAMSKVRATALIDREPVQRTLFSLAWPQDLGGIAA